MSDVSAVVVTYNALPWIEQCLESVRGVETVVVDHGSTDGTVAFVRERFPEVAVVEEENRGLAFGWNTGIARTSGPLRPPAQLGRVAARGRARRARRVRRRASARGGRRAAAAATPTGRCSARCAAIPTLWRIATEYLFLRKLAPRSRALNAFYAGGFAHDELREAEWLMGAVWLVRRAAIDEVGPADDGVLPLQRGDRLGVPLPRGGLGGAVRPRTPARRTSYGGSHGGRLLVENVRSQLRFLREAPRRRVRARRAAGSCVLGLLLRRKLDVVRAL